MHPRQPFTTNGRTYRLTLPSSPPATAQNSFASPYSSYSVEQLVFSPQLHRLYMVFLHSFRTRSNHTSKPPAAPRLRSVPLPAFSPTYAPTQLPPTGRDVFPIDLTSEIDFEVLARGLANFGIPAHTTIYVLPASRDRSLLQIDTGDSPAHAVSIIRRLHSILHAPLSPQVYRTGLQPAVQEAVRRYFHSRGGSNGAHLWHGFMNGFEHCDGPRGVVLLQGHTDMWGFSQDHRGHSSADIQRVLFFWCIPCAPLFWLWLSGVMGRAIAAPGSLTPWLFCHALKNAARSGEASAVKNAEINIIVLPTTHNGTVCGHACVGTSNFRPQFKLPSKHVEKSGITAADAAAGQNIWAKTTGNTISARFERLDSELPTESPTLFNSLSWDKLAVTNAEINIIVRLFFPPRIMKSSTGYDRLGAERSDSESLPVVLNKHILVTPGGDSRNIVGTLIAASKRLRTGGT
ncbi:hypothetical protein DFH08DRAFT_941985 [Mycena albidolilacea]|uniref:Uncharacterized protein n=1 Tax=Mycena albidolilacea TaxID=1033008 RepID=A0AAD6ZFW3_9AGAR|nr:hypothetical protein DFH08DRAFT_941985 [Mycena albidolilacea]